MKPSIDPSIFEALRPRLLSIAYRMLGSRADAQDVVQDAWLRWTTARPEDLRSDDAWLVTVTTRLAVDRLRRLKTEREAYVGWWLPEPVVAMQAPGPEEAAELADEISVAMLWVLERLAPEERAAFLMRKVFDQDYSELAAILGKSQSACRQLVHRAQQRIGQEHPRFAVPEDVHREVLARFMRAAARADRAAMKSLLSADVEFRADGGGKVAAIDRLLVGAGRVAGLFWAVENAFPGKVAYRLARVNGEPGLIRYIDGALESVQSFSIRDGRIAGIYAIRNPDKLKGIGPTAPAPG